MPEQLQKIINRVVEWWKKFNTKQKALMISLTGIVIVALVILGVVMTRPQYTTLIDCENTKSSRKFLMEMEVLIIKCQIPHILM